MADVVIAGVGAAIAGVGTAASIITSQKAADAQEDAYEAQKKQVAVENARAENANYSQTIQRIREGRIARASALAAGISSGAEEGSGVQGAVGSISSQTAFNVGTLQQDIALARQSAAYGTEAAGYMSDANRYNAWGNIFAGAANIGGSLFSHSANISAKIENTFGTKKGVTTKAVAIKGV